jgi:hypothetical protein
LRHKNFKSAPPKKKYVVTLLLALTEDFSSHHFPGLKNAIWLYFQFQCLSAHIPCLASQAKLEAAEKQVADLRLELRQAAAREVFLKAQVCRRLLTFASGLSECRFGCKPFAYNIASLDCMKSGHVRQGFVC